MLLTRIQPARRWNTDRFESKFKNEKNLVTWLSWDSLPSQMQELECFVLRCSKVSDFYSQEQILFRRWLFIGNEPSALHVWHCLHIDPLWGLRDYLVNIKLAQSRAAVDETWIPSMKLRLPTGVWIWSICCSLVQYPDIKSPALTIVVCSFPALSWRVLWLDTPRQ